MPIPTSRVALLADLNRSYTKLIETLDELDSSQHRLVCVDAWTVEDLLAVRLWWTERVLALIDAGLRNKTLEMPAPGFRWGETPQLNEEVVAQNRKGFSELYRSLNERYEELITRIDSLNDHQLLSKGVFEGAGNYPIARWVSINTTRQYTTARTYIRRALKG